MTTDVARLIPDWAITRAANGRPCVTATMMKEHPEIRALVMHYANSGFDYERPGCYWFLSFYSDAAMLATPEFPETALSG